MPAQHTNRHALNQEWGIEKHMALKCTIEVVEFKLFKGSQALKIKLVQISVSRELNMSVPQKQNGRTSGSTLCQTKHVIFYEHVET